MATGSLPNGSAPDAGSSPSTVDLGVHSTTALVPVPAQAQDGSLSGLRHRRRALAELVATSCPLWSTSRNASRTGDTGAPHSRQ